MAAAGGCSHSGAAGRVGCFFCQRHFLDEAHAACVISWKESRWALCRSSGSSARGRGGRGRLAPPGAAQECHPICMFINRHWACHISSLAQAAA